MITAEEERDLRAMAEQLGRDPEAFVAAARKADGEQSKKPAADKSEAPSPEKPKLFQYHLPFVTVKEVRSNWLGLTEQFAGDGEIAAEWAAKHGGGAGGTPTE